MSTSALILIMLKLLHFLLPNEDQGEMGLLQGPDLDFKNDKSLAAVKDKASLEKQSCWEVTLPPPLLPVPQAGRGHPRQLFL